MHTGNQGNPGSQSPLATSLSIVSFPGNVPTASHALTTRTTAPAAGVRWHPVVLDLGLDLLGARCGAPSASRDAVGQESIGSPDWGVGER